jgi:hypothetical protein
MIQVVTTTANLTTPPRAYVEAGCCPQCGANIYHDADLPRDSIGLPTQLPQPYYTCSCRFNVPQAPVVYTYPILPMDPAPLTPTWHPQDPFPGRTVTCTPPVPITTAIPNESIPIGPGIDWKRFTGTGSISSKPDPHIICINAVSAGMPHGCATLR